MSVGLDRQGPPLSAKRPLFQAHNMSGQEVSWGVTWDEKDLMAN